MYTFSERIGPCDLCRLCYTTEPVKEKEVPMEFLVNEVLGSFTETPVPKLILRPV